MTVSDGVLCPGDGGHGGSGRQALGEEPDARGRLAGGISAWLPSLSASGSEGGDTDSLASSNGVVGGMGMVVVRGRRRTSTGA